MTTFVVGLDPALGIPTKIKPPTVGTGWAILNADAPDVGYIASGIVAAPKEGFLYERIHRQLEDVAKAVNDAAVVYIASTNGREAPDRVFTAVEFEDTRPVGVKERLKKQIVLCGAFLAHMPPSAFVAPRDWMGKNRKGRWLTDLERIANAEMLIGRRPIKSDEADAIGIAHYAAGMVRLDEKRGAR